MSVPSSQEPVNLSVPRAEKVVACVLELRVFWGGSGLGLAAGVNVLIRPFKRQAGCPEMG